MNIDTHSPLWIALGWTSLHVAWIGAAIGLAASIARRGMRRASPEARHAAALAGLLALAASPFAAFAAVYEPATIAPAVVTTAFAPRPTTAEAPPDPDRPSPSRPRPRETPNSIVTPSSWFDSWISILPGVWLAGTSLLLARTAAGVVGVERLRRSLKPLDLGPVAMRCRAMARSLGIARGVSIAACDRVAAPMLIGIVRPMVVLPAAALSGWDRDLVEMAMLHELAHLRRLDNLTCLFQKFVEALLFFHPTTWWLSAWLRLERESCCDALVVARTGDRVGYARLLAALADARPPALAAPLNERPITTRIRRILFMEDRPMTLKPTAPEALALAAAGLLAATLILPARAEPPAPREPDASAADLRRLAEIVAAQPSPPPPARLVNGPPPPDERVATLLKIAEAQLGADDRDGALRTLDRAPSPPTPGPDDFRDLARYGDAMYLGNLAAIRREAGDAEGARALYGRLVDMYTDIDAKRDAAMMRAMNRWIVAMTAREVRSDDPAMEVVQVRMIGAKDEPGEDLEKLIAPLESLEAVARELADAREVDLVRRLVAHASPLLDADDAPLATALMRAGLGRHLAVAGDGPAGLAMIAEAKAAVASLPDGDEKAGVALLLAYVIATADLDRALEIVASTPSTRRVYALRRILEGSCKLGVASWVEGAGLRINIGEPSLILKDEARARVDLPKFVAVARTIEDATKRARMLATLARLQAQAGDLDAALATAESTPELRRADHPGPADGFYDAVKPATFALIAAERARTGDRPGADAALARSASTTKAAADDVERAVAGLVLADAYEAAGRRGDAKAALADVHAAAAAQPEPRRSRMLGEVARRQVDWSGVEEASKTIDAIRDEPGVEKAAALIALANHLRDAGRAEDAAAAARRGLACLEPKASDPKAAPNARFGYTRDAFINYDAETTRSWLMIHRQTMRPTLLAIAGEPAPTPPAPAEVRRRRDQNAEVIAAFGRGGLDEALKIAGAIRDPSERDAAIRAVVYQPGITYAYPMP